MQTVSVSAPAKLFLLGEHAVVYEGRALVTAVDARLHLTLQHSVDDADGVRIDAPDVGLREWQAALQSVVGQNTFAGESRFIDGCLATFHRYHPLSGSLHITTHSAFDKNLGLGSSSATVAAMLYALAQLFAPQLTLHQLFEMGLEAIQLVQQKVGSGADLAAALFGGTVYYVNQVPREITPLVLNHLPIVAVYSGSKAGTVSYVQQVRHLYDTHTAIVRPIIASMLELVDVGRHALQQQDWATFGRLMNIQHGLLHALGVDTWPLANVVFAARTAGAAGAKLSGAGGGDCAIVLVSQEQRTDLQMKLREIGREILPFALNAAGVRVETS